MLRRHTTHSHAAHVHQHGLIQLAEVKASTRQHSVRCCSLATADPEVAERQAAGRLCDQSGQTDLHTLIWTLFQGGATRMEHQATPAVPPMAAGPCCG